MATAVKKELQVIIGLKLTLARRAASLQNFQFGQIRSVDHRTLGQYALHIQCPWRIEGPVGIVTGQADLPEPDEEEVNPDREGWTFEDGNLQDERLRQLFAGYDRSNRTFVNDTERLIVENVESDAYGGAVIFLSGGYRLVFFPCGSRAEDWRFFSHHSNSRHFVIAGGLVLG